MLALRAPSLFGRLSTRTECLNLTPGSEDPASSSLQKPRTGKCSLPYRQPLIRNLGHFDWALFMGDNWKCHQKFIFTLNRVNIHTFWIRIEYQKVWICVNSFKNKNRKSDDTLSHNSFKVLTQSGLRFLTRCCLQVFLFGSNPPRW